MKCKKCGEFFCDRYCPKCGELADGDEYYRELLNVDTSSEDLEKQLTALTENAVKDSVESKVSSKTFESKYEEKPVEYPKAKAKSSAYPKANNTTVKSQVYPKANNTTVNTQPYPKTNTQPYPNNNTPIGGYGNSNGGNKGYTPRNTPPISPFPNSANKKVKKTPSALVVVIIVVCCIIAGNFILNNINIDGDFFDEPIASFSHSSYTDYYVGETYYGEDYELTYVDSVWEYEDEEYYTVTVQWELTGESDFFDPDYLQCKTEDDSDVECINSDEFFHDDFYEENKRDTYVFYTAYRLPVEEDVMRICCDDPSYEELPCFVVEKF